MLLGPYQTVRYYPRVLSVLVVGFQSVQPCWLSQAICWAYYWRRLCYVTGSRTAHLSSVASLVCYCSSCSSTSSLPTAYVHFPFYTTRMCSLAKMLFAFTAVTIAFISVVNWPIFARKPEMSEIRLACRAVSASAELLVIIIYVSR